MSRNSRILSNGLPSRFSFLGPVLDQYGERLRRVPFETGLQVPFRDDEIKQLLSELPSRVIIEESAPELQEWIRSVRKSRPSVKEAAWATWGLLLLLNPVVLEGVDQGMAAADLPTNLQYVFDAAAEHRLQTEYDARKFVEGLDFVEHERLALLAKKILRKHHGPLIQDFIERFPVHKYKESCWLYFLLCAFDYAGIQFEQ